MTHVRMESSSSFSALTGAGKEFKEEFQIVRLYNVYSRFYVHSLSSSEKNS